MKTQWIQPHCVIDGVAQPCGARGTVADISTAYLVEVGQWIVPMAWAGLAVIMVAAGILVGWTLSGAGQ